MGTLIKSLAFKNFYNFFGDYSENKYDFSEGLNIINADNGMGKSKIYNGILWIIKDQVYDSDTRSVVSISDSPLKVLSDKAKIEEQAPKAGVKMIFEDAKKTYIVEKCIAFIKKIHNASTSNIDDWNISEQSITVEVRDKVTGNAMFEYDVNEINKILKNKIVNSSLHSYALLQGEAIDNIVDLSNSEGLAKTIEVLTNIDDIKDLEKSANVLFKKADNDLSDVQKKHTSNKGRVDKLTDDKKTQENIIAKCQEQISIYKSELKEATKARDIFQASISNTEKRSEYRQKISSTDKEIEQLQKEMEIKLSKINDNLFKNSNAWTLLGMEDVNRRFVELRDVFQQEKAKMELLKDPNVFISSLPEGSPDDTSLKRMIKEERCFVCGRDAVKGSEEWLHMVKVKERSSKSETKVNPNNLTPFFSALQLSTQRVCGSQEDTFKEVADIRLEIIKIEKHIKSLSKEREEYKQEYINYGGKGDANQADGDVNSLNAYDRALEDIQRLRLLISKAENDHKTADLKIKQLDEELDKICGDDIPKENIDLKEMLFDIKEVFARTKERIYDKILESLETKSNEYYQKLTDGNNVVGGTLKFTKTDYDSISIDVFNEKGGKLTGASEGYQRMKKMAVVMAIISSKLGSHQFEYPFIADAPFSAFGKNFTKNFLTVVPTVFHQSIVLAKDLYDIDSEKLINDDGEMILNKMKNGEIKGKFYVNFITKKVDTTDLTTQIKCYK